MGAPSNHTGLKLMLGMAFTAPALLIAYTCKQANDRLKADPNYMSQEKIDEWNQWAKINGAFYGGGALIVSGLGKTLFNSFLSSMSYSFMNQAAQGPKGKKNQLVKGFKKHFMVHK